MSKIQNRKIQVLKHIIEEYLKTGEIMGSKNLLKKYDLQVSSATVRNDMASLEDMGLIFQPYNSAGRLPTHRGIRVFVDYLMETLPAVMIDDGYEDTSGAPQEIRIDDQIYEINRRLTRITGEITFVVIPTLGILHYLGIGNYLDRHHGIIGDDTFRVVQCLEDKYEFIRYINHLNVNTRIAVFIGQENTIPELQESAMIVKRIEINGYIGYLGILGSTMMDYGFNITAMRQIL